MVSFGNIASKSKTVAIEFEGDSEPLYVTYDASNINPTYFNNLTSQIDEDDFTGAAQLFCSIVTKWTLEGPLGDGEFEVAAGDTIPLEAGYVAQIPTPVLNAILKEVTEDAAPKLKKSKTSSRR